MIGGLTTWGAVQIAVFLYLLAGWIKKAFFPAPPPAPRPGGSVILHPVGAAAFAAAKAKAAPNALVVVDFFATWCGPCVAIAPFLEELAEKHSDVLFIKVQEDESRDVLAAEAITCFPTFRFYVAGKCVKQMLGANQAGLAAAVASLKAAAAAGEALPEVDVAAGGVAGGCAVM